MFLSASAGHYYSINCGPYAEWPSDRYHPCPIISPSPVYPSEGMNVGKSKYKPTIQFSIGPNKNNCLFTITIAYLASSLEPHAPPIMWRFAEINHYVGLRSDTNIPCRDHLWPLPGLLIINIHFTQCYARYYPYFTCR